ncbi:MAG: serine/threonine protein kinase, partial [Planctomycetes bacterium]|nr:serine/threonine protein kinase [Planctomycetota bacterium]
MTRSADDCRARERALFDRAIALDGEERAEFVRGLTRNAPDLAERVHELVAAYERSASFEAPPPGVPQHGASAPPIDVGSRLGPYRIIERLGEGGMGEVFLAEQQEPVPRRVAIKLIKRGMDTREIVSRFRSEYRVLSLLDHPNVARVFDCDAAPDGRPYFALEHVPGRPITEFCDEKRLDISGRLRLVIDVCRGVQHAHQTGILHRDLKPSNILVTERYGGFAPKIIDFGVAKLTSAELALGTAHTQLGDVVGTPDYMSPEQAGAAVDLDTRSDVYALGIVLYELLVGSSPYGRGFRDVGLEEAKRAIREVEPRRPSTNLPGNPEAAARARDTDVRRWARRLRGDLDWIILTCLAKERALRYDSAAELAADIERHLADEPVVARPPTVVYRSRKFVRKHRRGVTVAVLFLVSLLCGLTWAFVEKERAERSADDARRALVQAKTMSSFLADALSSASPYRARGLDTTLMMRVLGNATARIQRGELAATPEAELELRLIVARVYDELGELELESDILRGTERLARDLHGERSDALARAVSAEARVLGGRGMEARAQERFEEAHRLFVVAGTSESADAARVLTAQANCLGVLGRLSEAIDKSQAAASCFMRLEGERSEGYLSAILAEARATLAQGRWERASELARHAAELAESQPHGLRRIVARMMLGNIEMDRRRFGEASREYEACLELARDLHAGPHRDTILVRRSLAVCQLRMGLGERALEEAQTALDEARSLCSGDHSSVARTLDTVGHILLESSRPAEARSVLDQARSMWRRLHEGDHPDLAWALERSGRCGIALGRPREALREFEEALAMRRRLGGDDWTGLARSLM